MKKSFLLVFVCLFFCRCIYGMSSDLVKFPDDSAAGKKVWFFKGFFQDEAKLWSSPVRMTGKKFTFWVPVIGATMFALANDERIYSEFKSFQSKHEWVDKASPVVTYGGENVTTLGACGLFYFGGLVFKNKKAQQTGALCAEALAHAGLIVTVGKYITGRQRPSYNAGIDSWHWFPSTSKILDGQAQSKYDAFPSGHTIAAWSVATVIATRYNDYAIVPILAYTAATGVGLSRLTQDAHWMSDVIIGGALGYTIGRFIAKERKNTRWTLLPVSNGKNIMLSSSYKL